MKYPALVPAYAVCGDESCFDEGAVRVLTSLSIDERRDKELTIEGKKTAVREKLQA